MLRVVSQYLIKSFYNISFLPQHQRMRLRNLVDYANDANFVGLRYRSTQPTNTIPDLLIRDRIPKCRSDLYQI